MLRLIAGFGMLALSCVATAATIDGTWTDSSGQRVSERVGERQLKKDGNAGLGNTRFAVEDVRVVDRETRMFVIDYNETREGQKTTCPFALSRIPIATCTSGCDNNTLRIQRLGGGWTGNYEYWTIEGSVDLDFFKFQIYEWSGSPKKVWKNLRKARLSDFTNFRQDYRDISFINNMKLYVENHQIVLELGGSKHTFDSINDVHGSVLKINSGLQPITVYNRVSLGYPMPSPDDEFKAPLAEPYNYSNRASSRAYKLFDDKKLAVFSYYQPDHAKYGWKPPITHQKGKLDFNYVGIKRTNFKKNPSTGKFTGEVDLELEIGRFIPDNAPNTTAPFVGLIELYRTPIYTKHQEIRQPPVHGSIGGTGAMIIRDRMHYGTPSPITLPLNTLNPSNYTNSSCKF